VTSTTPMRVIPAPSVTVPVWSPMARLRRAAMTTRFVIGNAVSAARAYEGAQGPTARRAVLGRFTDDLR